MITDNYKKHVLFWLMGQETFEYKTLQGTNVNIESYDTSYITQSVDISSIMRNYPSSATTMAYDGIGIYFGDDNTPESKDDYVLHGNILNSKISILSTKVNYLRDGNMTQVCGILNLKNIFTEPITIKEIGLVGSNYIRFFLVDRTVLEEPLVLNPEEIKTVLYTIENIM